MGQPWTLPSSSATSQSSSKWPLLPQFPHRERDIKIFIADKKASQIRWIDLDRHGDSEMITLLLLLLIENRPKDV
jgi:hypothetical protein